MNGKMQHSIAMLQAEEVRDAHFVEKIEHLVLSMHSYKPTNKCSGYTRAIVEE